MDATDRQLLRIRQNIAADRKAAARRLLDEMERWPDEFVVNDVVPGLALVEPVHPLRRPRHQLPLHELTLEAARGGLRHLRYVGGRSLGDEARQAMQIAAIVYAMRMRAAVVLRKAA